MEIGLDKEVWQGAMTGRGWGFGDVSEVEGQCQCGISEQVSLRSKKLWLKNGAFGVKIPDVLQLLLA